MTQEELDKALKSIGKRSFVEDYSIYQSSELSKELKLDQLSQLYSRNGAIIRLSFAEKIFKAKQQVNALRIIIDSPRTNAHLRQAAQNILASIT